MGQDEFDRIQPADLEIAAARAESVPEPKARPGIGPVSAIVALLLLAAAVIFLLPRFVAPVSAPSPITGAASVAGAAGSSSPGAVPAGAPGSPWQQAQQERERTAAKATLDELLRLQFELQELGVEQWAGAEFSGAMDMARAGDESYRASRFVEAEQQYRNGVNRLQNLKDGMATRLQQDLDQGLAALNLGDGVAATRLFAEALSMEPDNAAAQQGAKRAASLDKVMALMQQAASLETAERNDEAAKLYREALTLDSDYQPAQAALNALAQKTRARDYTALLSSGYAALAAGDAERAKTQFQAAMKIDPQAAQARDGLQQAGFLLSQSALARAINRAEKAASAEQWQQAATDYSAALAIDASLGPAIQGKRNAEARTALETALQQISGKPHMLKAPKNRENAQKILAEASAITNPGPRLQSQIAAAQATLQKWSAEFPVILRSDNQTDVTLFRVGNLGRIEQQQLKLIPGRYIAIGQRLGYRDVRVEFEVEPGTTVPNITVACREKI